MSMAEAPAQLPGPAAGGGGKSIVKLIAAMLAMTIVAVAGGGGLGMKLADQIEETVRTQQTEQEAEAVKPPRYTGPTHLKALPPVLTNLAEPRDVWARMEASIVFSDEDITGEDVLAAEIAEDFLALLRTVTLSQIDGPSGMQHLRQDLEDRARVRSEGRVQEVVVRTLVFQ
jgi:flagellar FliL protein